MKDPNPTRIEMLLLRLLGDDEVSGRDVAKRFKEKTGRSISYGTLYVTFRHMADKGLVKTRDDQDEDGRIRFFTIDAEGRRALWMYR